MKPIRFFAGALLALGVLQSCDSGPTGPRTGSLTVSIANLPDGISAAVTVQGEPGTPAITVPATRTIPDLEPGVYTVTAAKAVGEKASYTPGVASQTVEVTAGSTPASVSIAYTLATGIVSVTISGLPAGTNASATLFNEAGFFTVITGTREIGNLEPGEYTLQVEPVAADEVYMGTPNPRTMTVAASPAPVPAQVTYLASTGTIEFVATGLPAGAMPVWDVSGPLGLVVVIRGPQLLSKLPPGDYTISARNFDFGAETYGAPAQSLVATVVAGTRARASFAYVTRPPSLNLTVEGAYFTQSSQRFDGTVPLVAGRDAFVRVFLKANELNAATPKVRLRIYRDGALASTHTIEPPVQSVGTQISQVNIQDSWGVHIPGFAVTGGLSFLVDVDPENTVREVSDSDNVFPASGNPQTLDVRAVPVVEVRFVPIETAVNGFIGNVTDTRVPELLSRTTRMFPISTISADVRELFTTSAPPLERDDANGSWTRIINELNTLRIAEGTLRHYIGVLRIPYASGVVGLGFLPGKTLLTWDHATGAMGTIAHELGHNWGRAHAPCGGPSGVDPSYPYPNARIGVYGFDLVSRQVVDALTRDVMSYCAPDWVSDYTYEGVLNFRGSSQASSSSASVQSSLVVWGRMEGAKLVLEPAFLTDTRPVLPVRPGRYRLRGLDRAGVEVFSLSFDPDQVGDAAGDVRQFGFAVPMDQSTASRIVTLRLSGNGAETRVTASRETAEITARAEPSGRVRLAWNSDVYPMLVVRDPDTKEIITFARGGTATIPTRKRTLEIAASNAVSSKQIRVAIPN